MVQAAEALGPLQELLEPPRMHMMMQGPGVAQQFWAAVAEALPPAQAAAEAWLGAEAQQNQRHKSLLRCAEAAATRGCSHLACTNLRGPSEAQLTAKRCSGCQTARYCCVACQRSDWKDGGHRELCRELRARFEQGGKR